ncbi:TOMM precursor leader peptide-binding protein [Saccharopolyspora taberi]|uniref:TOMM precursor leader peptide-binding protein n=1 Tax=Saccharopolyspora taberi TaxID=60895 RepID=UPI0031DD3044
MCSSSGALRVPFSGSEPERDGETADVAWWQLPDNTLAGLAERGLMVPADQPLRRHLSYEPTVAQAGPVRVLGDDPLSTSITSCLRSAGVDAVQAGEAAQAWVVSLAAPAQDLRTATEAALSDRSPVIVFACTPAKIHVGVLRPPETACPLCLERRIRANWPGQDIADAPLEILLGTCSEPDWPSNNAMTGLIAHAVLRAVGTRDHDPGVAELVELDLDSWASTRHPVLHLPSCPGCAQQVRTSAPPLAWRDNTTPALADSWQRMQKALDPLTGIFTAVRTRRPDDSEATLALTAGGIDTRWFSSVSAYTVSGSAKHDPLEASVCALGEGLERYAAGVYDRGDFVRGSLSELGPAALDPRELPLGSPAEYSSVKRFVPYQPDLVIDWVEGVELSTGKPRYVPAGAVYVPYHAPSRGERLLNSVSTGLAAGSTPAQALRGGLLEVVERDAFAIFWYNRLAAPILELTSLPPGPIRTVVERMRQRGIEITAKNITTDLGIPTVLMSGRLETPERPVVLHSSRSGLDVHEALQGACEELELGFCQIFDLLETREVPEDGAALGHMWDFYLYYCRADRVPLLDWLREGPVQPVPPPGSRSGGSDVDEIVSRLVAAGHQPIAVDITPVDVAECGVTVVRSIIPGLQPVVFSQKFRHLGGRRVFEAPVRMGARTHPLSEQELNLQPLPMA